MSGDGQITYGDLVPFAVEILKHSDVTRDAVRQTYSHVFLAEFQDCTNTQFTLIRAAFEGTEILLTAVGDTKQRIMTIHKSKGLEFHSVILLGVENEAFWGELAGERSVFFVGISRAKHRLVLTSVNERPTPSGKPRRWSVTRSPQTEFLGYADTP